MADSRAAFGLWFLALADLAFVVTAINHQLGAFVVLGFFVAAIGHVLAGHATWTRRDVRWTRLGIGLLVALAGFVPFTWTLLHEQFSRYHVAMYLYLGGTAIAAVAALVAARSVEPTGAWTQTARLGFAMVLAAACFWVPLDWGNTAWEPGDLLTVLGAALAAAFLRD